MLKLFVISLFTTFCVCTIRDKLNLHKLKIKLLSDKKTLYSYIPLQERNYSDFNYKSTNNTILYAKYASFLMDLSMKLLRNVHENIKNNYGLSNADINILEHAFIYSRIDYQFILKENIRKMIDNMNNSSPEVLLLDFTDFSNYLIQIIIESNLNKVNGEYLLRPSYAYNYLFKYSILRQQMKIVLNVIEINICDKFSICIEKSGYTEYLTEWLRHILNANSIKINNLFHEISHLSNKKMYNVTAMETLRQKIEIITASGCSYERSYVDFLDEVVSGHDIIKFLNKEFRKYVIPLKELFKMFDENYELNTTNEKELLKISNRLRFWVESENLDIRPVLENILDNLWHNIQIWPTQVHTDLQKTWTKIISI